MTLLILGLGNLLMSDDGVGVHAARALAADPPRGTVVLDVGTAVFGALSALEGAAAVIAIDAVDADEPPGTIVQYTLDESGPPIVPPSLHDLDFPALLRSLPPGARPPVTVVGVQPARIAPGLDLSPAVAGRLPDLLAAVREAARSLAEAP
jgi:hydrogenase maturation protease